MSSRWAGTSSEHGMTGGRIRLCCEAPGLNPLGARCPHSDYDNQNHFQTRLVAFWGLKGPWLSTFSAGGSAISPPTLPPCKGGALHGTGCPGHQADLARPLLWQHFGVSPPSSPRQMRRSFPANCLRCPERGRCEGAASWTQGLEQHQVQSVRLVEETSGGKFRQEANEELLKPGEGRRPPPAPCHHACTPFLPRDPHRDAVKSGLRVRVLD